MCVWVESPVAALAVFLRFDGALSDNFFFVPAQPYKPRRFFLSPMNGIETKRYKNKSKEHKQSKE
jgi:hypothetical protein